MVAQRFCTPLSRQVSCSRMVLFLVKNEEKPGKATWLAANTLKMDTSWRQIKVSTDWIEKGQAFAFVQVTNPGPTLLIPLEMDEGKLKGKVTHKNPKRE